MATWKELGEVPDSEEEAGFDSQDLDDVQPAAVATTTTTATKDGKSLTRDIWEFPSSAESEALGSRPFLKTAQLQAKGTRAITTETLTRKKDIWELPSSKEPNENRGADDDLAIISSPKPLATLTTTSTALSEPDSPLTTAPSSPDELSSPIGEPPELETLPAQEDRRDNPVRLQILIQQNRASPVPEVSEASDQFERLPSPSRKADIADAQEAQQISLRHERSLRPRKPIQEHPYLLENAQYSTFCRQRGIKPVRMTEDSASEQPEQESQDAESQHESQEGATGPAETDESQQIDDDPAPEESQVMLLSPSPPETSPPRNGVEASSVPNSQATQDTFDDDYDLPDIDQLLAHRPGSQFLAPKLTTRRVSQPHSASRKRKLQEAFSKRNATTSPDALGQDPSAMEIDLTPTREIHDANLIEFDAPLADEPSSRSRLPIIDISSEDEDEESDREAFADRSSLDGGQGRESEKDQLVSRIGKRIRGVLPASWLRLDQQSSRDKAQSSVHNRQQQRTLDQGPRRGVAQPRQNLPGSTLATADLIFEDSEDEARLEVAKQPLPSESATDDVFHHQTRLNLEVITDASVHDLSSDDASSIMEDDFIEPMMPGRQRQLKLSGASEGSRKKMKKTVSQLLRAPSQKPKPKQIRITSLLPKSAREKGRSSTKREGRKFSHIRMPPPLLSILDVIQEDAPRFIRIAARTARRRSNQGRSSVGGKSIKLASRQDHVDAVSVLQDWRKGVVKQRPAVTAACKFKQRRAEQPPPLSNFLVCQTDPFRSQSETRKQAQTLERQISQAGSTSSKGARPGPKNPDQRDALPASFIFERPAQLEIAQAQSGRILKFSALKRIIDRSYQGRAKKSSMTASVQSLERVVDAEPTVEASNALADPPRGLDQRRKPYSGAPRSRKQKKPNRVDIDAPQYLHANDPLPMTYLPGPEANQDQARSKKLTGLGPYGTRYTHHFEVFPLEPGVFFHESTLLGRGIINICLDQGSVSRMCHLRPRIHLNLGYQVLRWGPWDDQTSSEIGIVFDYMAEEIKGDSPMNETLASDETGALGAAHFVLRYITEALSTDQESMFPAIVARFHQVLSGFCDRASIQVREAGGTLKDNVGPTLKIFDRLLIVSLFVLKLCRLDNARLLEQMQMEQTIRAMACISLSIMEKSGLSQLTNIYNDLARPNYRERGLRNDVPVLHSCTLLIKVLELAQIQRCTLWDVLEEVINLPQAISSLDVQRHERAWETLFILLPLTEFDNHGIIRSGKRQRAAVDGWSIPQKLLRSVFESYHANARQAPSFNNYCCALVGRCQYLLQQWGWHRAAPVIGVIFDFFGTQGFAHLRNEEVYTSPRFLDELAKRPCLDLEPNDRCFHVFLKLLASSFLELRKAGLEKDIRNLVARTIPNHNRQYLKEQNIHERDLAALRNQHDLIVTQYWACPQKLRPSVALLERLVTPEMSHKEACLINLRAWSQLARFAVATGEATTFPKQFGPWRNTFFLKVMQQFDSVASDIQQQLMSLSKDVSDSISQDMVNAMIALNKAAAKDILVASLAASLDVMRQAPDLEAASFCFSSPQLLHVLRHFTTCPPELDWSILRIALSILGSFLSKIEEFKDNEESLQNESQMLNSALADDALMVIDNDLSRNFFFMARSTIRSRSETATLSASDSDRLWCIKEAIVLSARLGVRFISGGIVRISDMFIAGKYGVFNGLPRTLDLNQRRYLPLFLSHLLSQGFVGFANAEFSLVEAWTLSLVTPRGYLEFENLFAHQLHKHKRDFVPESVVGLSSPPAYSINRVLFEFAISSFRKGIREAPGPSLRKVLVKEYADVLEAVMTQMKADVQAVVGDAAEHHAFVIFVRQIISLIKVHGSEFCAIDEFFYKVSKEYSPSKEDPQLYVAGMISYGLRLQEGDMRVAHELFYLLFNNFKFALASDRLVDDVKMLAQGMRHEGIFSFILGKMVPSILQASFDTAAGFVLLDVYVQALSRHLQKRTIARELLEGDLPHVDMILQVICDGIPRIWDRERYDFLGDGNQHLLKQSLALVNLLWPLMFEFCISNAETKSWMSAVQRLHLIGTVVSGWSEALVHFTEHDPSAAMTRQLGVPVFLDTASKFPPQNDVYVDRFTKDIVDDIGRNWVCEGRRIMVNTPGQARGTQRVEQGTEIPGWGEVPLATGLFEEVMNCMDWSIRVFEAMEHCGAYRDLGLWRPMKG